jgi:Nucleolar protein,Nop52
MKVEADAAAGALSAKLSEVDKKKLTKRQKRKQVNEKNKWPQHPKIQDMEVRNKAYLRVAGLGTSTQTKETIDPTLDLLSPEVKFCRLLGSTDQRKRHQAVQKLKAYLRARCDIGNENGGISELDLLKLWKGLWYTLYMADKVPVQDELSQHLAELLWCVSGTEEEDEYAGQAYMHMCEAEDDECDCDDDLDGPEVTFEELDDSDDDNDDNEKVDHDNGEEEEEANQTTMEEIQQEVQDGEDEAAMPNSEIPHCRGAHLASLFIRTFFRTVRREWGRMDKYRVDKFYTLARMYMHEIYLYMAKRHWNIGIIRLFNDAMFEEVLNQKPNGLRYHLIDVALDELAKVNAKAPLPMTEATFLDALEPYFAMCQTGAGGDDIVQGRVMENILQKFLTKYSFISEADDDEARALIFDEVHVGTVAQFIFELASDQETKDKYRKSMYDMHKAYLRRLKKMGTDVPLEQEEENGDDVNAGDENDASDADMELEVATGDAPVDAEEESEDDEEDDVPPPPTPKKAKKKKHKKRRHAEETTQEETGTENKPSNKKSKKEKKASKTDISRAVEEVVTISIDEQKRAKALDKRKQKAKNKEEKAAASESSDSSAKRVKWLPNNKSKSYTASMKGLATATPPKTSEVTPEKGILLNKGKVRRAGVSKAGRKKAANYF